MSYSQNQEDLIVKAYFHSIGRQTGVALSVGENDGLTFSNVRLLIESGWNAYLFEPSTNAYLKLSELYKDSNKVTLWNAAIGKYNDWVSFHESGAHVKGGSDVALVSTTVESEMLRWDNVNFMPTEVYMHRWDSLPIKDSVIDFISIDAEGCDWDILQQINLSEVGCKCLCIEWNSQPHLAKLYTDYCAQFGLKEIHRNTENIIYVI